MGAVMHLDRQTVFRVVTLVIGASFSFLAISARFAAVNTLLTGAAMAAHFVHAMFFYDGSYE
jgi:hypothetical protein